MSPAQAHTLARTHKLFLYISRPETNQPKRITNWLPAVNVGFFSSIIKFNAVLMIPYFFDIFEFILFLALPLDIAVH